MTDTDRLAALLHDLGPLYDDGFHHIDCHDAAARLIEQGVRVGDDGDYEAAVGRMADALHEDCRLEWQAIAVVDPERMVTQHGPDAHYGKAHDLVRRYGVRVGDDDDTVERIESAYSAGRDDGIVLGRSAALRGVRVGDDGLRAAAQDVVLQEGRFPRTISGSGEYRIVEDPALAVVPKTALARLRAALAALPARG